MLHNTVPSSAGDAIISTAKVRQPTTIHCRLQDSGTQRRRRGENSRCSRHLGGSCSSTVLEYQAICFVELVLEVRHSGVCRVLDVRLHHGSCCLRARRFVYCWNRCYLILTNSVSAGFSRHGVPPPASNPDLDRLTLKLVCELHL